MVLRIGGPALLFAFSQQNKLPCASYIYKIMQNNIQIQYSLMESCSNTIRSNLKQFFSYSDAFYSIKMDEIALMPRARWSPDNNEITGFCFNHKHEVNSFIFETYLSVNEIKKKFVDNKIHLAKEALCITILQLSSSDSVPKPVYIVPTCSKTLQMLETIVKSVVENFIEINPSGEIINIATDGDPYRRKILNSLRSKSSDDTLKSLKYFSCDLVYGKYSVNFDIKHLIKRIRGILISQKRQMCLIQRKVNRTNLELLIPSKQHLLNPKDYQNVPYAVELMNAII